MGFSMSDKGPPQTAPPKRPRRGRPAAQIVALLGSLAAGIAGTVTVLDSWDKILEDVGLRKSDAFVLAEQSAQGDLVRQMTKLVSQRLFWISRYSGDVADGFPPDDQETAWKHYNDAVVTWNENYMINVLLTEKYFGDATMKQLADINWLMHQMNNCLNKIHYRSIYEPRDPACHFNTENGGTQEQNLDALNKTSGQVDTAFGAFLKSLSK
jgi:hypothetical protein